MKIEHYKLRIDLIKNKYDKGVPPISVVIDLQDSIASHYYDIPHQTFIVYYHNNELFSGNIDFTENIAWLDGIQNPRDSALHGVDRLTFLDLVLKYRIAIPVLKNNVLDKVAALKKQYEGYKFIEEFKV